MWEFGVSCCGLVANAETTGVVRRVSIDHHHLVPETQPSLCTSLSHWHGLLQAVNHSETSAVNHPETSASHNVTLNVSCEGGYGGGGYTQKMKSGRAFPVKETIPNPKTAFVCHFV